MIDVLLLTNSRFFFCGMPFSISTFLHNHFFYHFRFYINFDLNFQIRVCIKK
jgi:hypothetical protein